MNWLKSFFGLYEKRSANKEIEVEKYIELEKIKFQANMAKLREQAREVHEDTKKSKDNAIKVCKAIDDITAKIALATGTYKIVKR